VRPWKRTRVLDGKPRRAGKHLDDRGLLADFQHPAQTGPVLRIEHFDDFIIACVGRAFDHH